MIPEKKTSDYLSDQTHHARPKSPKTLNQEECEESRPSTAPVFDDWTRQTMLRYHGHQQGMVEMSNLATL